MVTGSGRSDGRERRREEPAQLVLAGAFTLGFLIIGLVVVFNSAFATGSVGDSVPPVESDDTAELNLNVRRTAQALALRVGHARAYDDRGVLAGAYRADVRNYSAALAETAIESQGVYVNASFDNTSTTYGTRVVQREDGEFLAPPSAPAPRNNWTPLTGGRLGWLVANLDTQGFARTDGFVMNASNGSDWLRVGVTRETASDDLQVEVVSSLSGVSALVSCEATGGRVVVDFYRGRSPGGGCLFPGFERLEGPVDIEFVNGTDARGRYEFVALGGSYPATGNCSPTPDATPCETPALWEVSVVSEFRNGRTSYTNDGNVSVYDR
jgi:hypothetical protein